MKDIYDKINDIEFSTDEMDLNDIERQRLYKKAKSYSKTSRIKVAGLAAGFIICLIATQSPARATVSKAFTDIKVSMMETIGASPESYKYITDLHKPIKIGGNELILENFITEDNKLYYTLIEDASGKSLEDYESDSHIYKLVVDGEVYRPWGSSGSLGVDKENNLYISEYMTSFDKDFPNKNHAKIDIYLSSNNKSEVISLESDLNKVNDENHIFAENMSLEDGINLKLIKINPLAMTAIIEGLDGEFFYKLTGVNEDGKKISLDQRTQDKDQAQFTYNKAYSDLSLEEIKNSKKLSFTLSRTRIGKASGKNNDYEDYIKFNIKND